MFWVNNCQRKDMLKVAQIWTILINFGFFLPGNKDSHPWLWDLNLLALPQNSQKDSNLRIPIRGFVSPLFRAELEYLILNLGSAVRTK
jgi:hypothetical protein